MCGRYNFSKNSNSPMVQKVIENLQSRQIEVKTGDVNPGDIAAVIASNRKLEPQAFGMKWGYQLPDGKLIFNARSETAAQKAMFADGMRQRRCLIPADCYYEWQKTGIEKQKYQLVPTNTNGFFLAGIYRIEQGIPVFSILTKEPVESISFIHNRMPVILPNEIIKDWLNPQYHGQELLNAALQNMSFLEYHSFIGSVLQLLVWFHTGNFSFSKKFCILVSCFYVLNRIKGRGPQKEQRKVMILMDEFQARRLVNTYADMILRISYQYLKQTYDAEDICQTVFLKYISNNMTFDSIEHEKAWIIRTAINACKDHVKSSWFKRTVTLEDAATIAAPAVPNTWLLDAMKELPEKYRISLHLYYYEEYSAREIAEVMGVSESAVGQYLTRGRRKLRAIITDEERRMAL